jgi:hypothetical protein
MNQRQILIEEIRSRITGHEGDHCILIDGLFYCPQDVDLKTLQPVAGAKGISKAPKSRECYEVSGIKIYF